MKNGKLELIIENIISENETNDMFNTKLDPINVYVTGVEKWDKYKSTFGEKKFDDLNTENFRVLWDADFEYKRDGIYGLIVDIENVYGTMEFIMYEDQNDTGTIEFGKDDFEKMTLVNEPKMSEYHQLFINGIEIDFNRNTVTIEYL